MTKLGGWWWKGAAPALAALLAASCGRSLTLDDRPKIDAGTGGSSSPGSLDASAGGSGGASGIGGTTGLGGKSGIGGATGLGGTTGLGGATGLGGKSGIGGADAGVDRGPPDIPPDRPPPPPDVGGCPADCTTLPHVRSGFYVPCINGVCSVGGACETGFAHCNGLPNVGCETNVSASPNCGSCGNQCYSGYECRFISGAYYYCVQPCPAPEMACDFSCADLQNDPNNCGGCGTSCYAPGTLTACQQGHCVALGCADSTTADCDTAPGCETTLGSDQNCGGCNDPACTLANTMFTCSDGLGCTASVCEVGFANCNASSPDCETEIASTAPAGGGCLPRYLGSVGLATQSPNLDATAIAADGSFFIAGTYQGTVDFDPSSTGKDIRTTSDLDGYITKLNADGSYAWTATLGGRGGLSLQALATTPAGGVIATGWYQDTIDLDPSGAQDVRITNDASNNDTYLVELSASGAEVWGRTFPSVSFGSNSASTGIAVDGAGAVYVTGSFFGTVDFDPGAGSDTHTGSLYLNTGFLVKLTSTGDRAWSRIVDDTDCSTSFRGVAVATDGSAWATGAVAQSTTCALASANGPYQNTLIMKVNAAGDTRTTWTVGDGQSPGGAAIAAGRNGAVYIGGIASGDADLDPGPGTVRRWVSPAYSLAGFVLKLAADGTFQWARVLSSASEIDAMAPAPDGGVLVGGRSAESFVTRLTDSGAAVWTLPIGDSSVALMSVASSATGFAISGTSSGTQDLDPGPTIDLLFGDIAFVSHFSF